MSKANTGWPQRSPTFGPPEQSHHGIHLCDLCRIRMCRVATIQITSCPPKKVVDTFHFCDLCRGCTGTEIIPEPAILDFQIPDFLISETDAKKRPKRRKLGPHNTPQNKTCCSFLQRRENTQKYESPFKEIRKTREEGPGPGPPGQQPEENQGSSP